MSVRQKVNAESQIYQKRTGPPKRGINAKKVADTPLARKVLGWADDKTKCRYRSDLAKSIGMDPARFSKLFSAGTGSSPTRQQMLDIADRTGIPVEILMDDSIDTYEEAMRRAASHRSNVEVAEMGISDGAVRSIMAEVEIMLREKWTYQQIASLLANAGMVGFEIANRAMLGEIRKLIEAGKDRTISIAGGSSRAE